MKMHPANEQAAALAFELHMHLSDLLDDKDLEGGSVALVSEDSDEEVGRFTELGEDGQDHSFLVKTEDGTVLRVTVEVLP
jgi:hypothetical protein